MGGGGGGGGGGGERTKPLAGTLQSAVAFLSCDLENQPAYLISHTETWTWKDLTANVNVKTKQNKTLRSPMKLIKHA